MNTNKPKTVNQRVQKLRDTRRANNQVRVEEWVFAEDAPRLKLYAAKLRKARALADLDQQ